MISHDSNVIPSLEEIEIYLLFSKFFFQNVFFYQVSCNPMPFLQECRKRMQTLQDYEEAFGKTSQLW